MRKKFLKGKVNGLEAVSSFIGTNVYCNGKVIGRITDIVMDMSAKKIKSLKCISNTGIIRSKFFVTEEGILHLDRNGAVIDKNSIVYNMKEEYSGFGITRDSDYFAGSVGDIYIDPETHRMHSVSVKQGLLDDLIFGRAVFEAKDISLTDKGQIIINKD